MDIASVEEEPYWNLKSAEDIEKSLLELGITNDTVVILYGPDVSGTARVAYAYLWMGVDNVKVLDGGLAAWKDAGYELETAANEPTPVAEFGVEVPANPEYWLSIEDAAKKLEEDPKFRLV